MIFEKIFIYAILANALINLYFIVSDAKKKKDKLTLDDFMFFRGYIYLVPFFLTRGILKEINEKEQKIKSRKTK
jgi:hypothetical protein